MKVCGIWFPDKNIPALDPGFIPFGAYLQAFEASAKRRGGIPLAIALERNSSLISVYDTHIHGTVEFTDADRMYVERLVKTLLWMKGGYRITICGDEGMADFIRQAYCAGGERAFDADFMAKVYEQPFEVTYLPYKDRPTEKETGLPAGGNLTGCRIGFDAGGSDRKVSAVIDGEAVFSEEVVWHPKINSDPKYHYEGIVRAFKTAASHMPRVDAIGVSSAGIYVDNRCMVASIFLKVPQELFDKEVKDIYIRAAMEIGDVPVAVCNDGDVAALAGAMDLGENNVLGIAMGTSEAAGFIDADGYIKGWLNELAFTPIDLNEYGAVDEWSGDKGCGVKYFSQDAVIKLAPAAGIVLAADASPAEKLKAVQELAEQGDDRAKRIFKSIGVYLGHGLALYHRLYGMKHVLLLGRVMSGEGGGIIYDTAMNVLEDEYQECFNASNIQLPDERSRRVGQSVAAAGLPRIHIVNK